MGNIKKIARCIRNNNPLNIRRGTARWKGIKREEEDEDFEQFETMAYGWRAPHRCPFLVVIICGIISLPPLFF